MLIHLEMHGCVCSTVAADVLVLKHQAISIHSADEVFILLDQLKKKKITFVTFIANNTRNGYHTLKRRIQLGPSTIARNTAFARGRRAKQPEVGTDLPWRLAAHC